ncbi:hypothetical protein H0H81_004522 [Sphagnurus paluster]|uniref:Uncharacterized protein n=1 Tax=Sphagnurus paluster TaxID=117069 RepID=A0A9P7FY78_9AGAR|nr:hypothetical protein H0H81_004522 [Sphagnurus paluster]
MMSTPAPQVNASNLPIERYHALSDTAMDNLLESLETLIDDLGNPNYEVDGPKRYDYSEADDNWLYSRDGCGMRDLLNDELSKALGEPVDIKI